MHFVNQRAIITMRNLPAAPLILSLLIAGACAPETDIGHTQVGTDPADPAQAVLPQPQDTGRPPPGTEPPAELPELDDNWQLAAHEPAVSKTFDEEEGRSTLSFSPTKFSAIFHQGSNHRTAINQSWTEFVNTWQTYSNQGFRLIDIATAIDAGERRYTGVFQPGNDGYSLWVGALWSSFASHWSTASSQGLRLVDFETYLQNGTRVYTGVYRSGTDSHYLWVGADWAYFVAKWSELAAAGLRLIDIEVWEENGGLRYGGVWRSGTDGYYLWVGVSWNGFAKKWMELGQQGLRLVDMEAYTYQGRRLYAGVFRTGSGSYDLVGASSRSALDRKIAALAGEGKQPVALEYEFGEDMPPPGMAAVFADVIDGHAVGYSYAVAESGQTIIDGGQGYARAPWEPVDPAVPMTGSKRSRIASVSKPITAVAIMDLLEANPGITLDTPFVEILGNRLPPVAAGVQNVTLRNLLQHRSGMASWGYCGPDLDASMADLVIQPLARSIGTYSYSNGNFCLLHMVVEELSGQDYVTYVKNAILAPMGISAMSCTPDSSQPTLYYEHNDTNQLGFFWSDDYAGHCGAYGWYASAGDLARFLVGVRNNTVLSAATTTTLLTQGLGWFSAATTAGTGYHHNGAWVTGDGRGYNGAIIRLPNNTEAVILINTNGYLSGNDYFQTVGTLVDGFNRMQTY